MSKENIPSCVMQNHSDHVSLFYLENISESLNESKSLKSSIFHLWANPTQLEYFKLRRENKLKVLKIEESNEIYSNMT
jgi:hypothetical protein